MLDSNRSHWRLFTVLHRRQWCDGRGCNDVCPWEFFTESPQQSREFSRRDPIADRFVPGLNRLGADRWMGYRPSLPDSLPVIGKAPGQRRTYLAFGHGHLGLTMAAVTGEIIATLASGRTPSIDLSPFRADRF